MNKDIILSIRNLKITFKTFNGSVQAVNGVNLDVGRGEIIGLVGESGCGKSVTAKAILRLLPKRSTAIDGKILFNGRDLLSLGAKEILKIRGNAISMIFQEPMTSLNPGLKVGFQIAEALVLHQHLTWSKARQEAIRMLDQVRIPSPAIRADNYPHSLSGGMRQRAMIAMALSCRPALLLADEPTTALDVTIQAQIMALMKQLQAGLNTAIVLITHDLGLIAEVAERVLVMYAGRVVEEASVGDLYRNPRHPYTQGLLGSIPVLGKKFTGGRKALVEIPGSVPSLFNLPSGCPFHPRCSQVMDICRTQSPPETSPDATRKVSCWLHGEKE
jgi:oligopeptide/dipeptide ABC transporter ATP-binding protein